MNKNGKVKSFGVGGVCWVAGSEGEMKGSVDSVIYCICRHKLCWDGGDRHTALVDLEK